MNKSSLLKIELVNYSYTICPVCWKKKDDTTTYTHINCWKELSRTDRMYLIYEFNPYQPSNKLGRKYIMLSKDWRKQVVK
jgi:hypothetical protein